MADAVLKDVMPQMEHPFYSLSKKPETSGPPLRAQWQLDRDHAKRQGPGDHLRQGHPDLLHFADHGEAEARRAGFAAGADQLRDLLIFTNRGTAGKDYMALIEALDRLEGTRSARTSCTGDEEQIDGFGLIDASSIRRKHGLDGRLLWCEIKLSDWVFNAIRAQEVLTLHRDYFRLRKPIERRVYELARKHCGQQDEWRVSAGDRF